MNIDEFLAENNLQVLYTLPTSLIWPPGPPAGGSSGEPSQGGDQPRAGRAQLRLPQHDELRFSATCGREPCFKALHHRLKRWLCSTCPLPDQPNSQIRCDQVLLSAPTTSSTRSRSAPSWRGRRRRGARDGKLRSSLRLRFEHSALSYFSPKNTLQDLALATVPGADFDPSERAFDMEELRPQPIIRKRAKQFVSAEKKDDKYWESRTKNTIAARRWDICLIFTCRIFWVTAVAKDQERREGWRKIRSLCERLSSRRRTSAWGRMWRKPTLPLRVKRWRLDNVLFHSMH